MCIRDRPLGAPLQANGKAALVAANPLGSVWDGSVLPPQGLVEFCQEAGCLSPGGGAFWVKGAAAVPCKEPFPYGLSLIHI